MTDTPDPMAAEPDAEAAEGWTAYALNAATTGALRGAVERQADAAEPVALAEPEPAPVWDKLRRRYRWRR